MAVLGIDYGERRIGVAIAHGSLAVPLTVIESAGEDADMERISSMAGEYGVDRIVVGLPRSLDGSAGEQAGRAIAFAEALSKRTDITVDTCDERLSTVSADRMLREAGTKQSKKRANRDAVAAAIILQTYIDGMKV